MSNTSEEHIIKFSTGTWYKGPLDEFGKMTGLGTYHFPNGLEYRGHFEDGAFHGRGMIIDRKTKFKMSGYFIYGRCKKFDFFFGDGLEYQLENWQYCTESDRRFWIEINQGLSPVGLTFLTKEKPARFVPPGHYDCEEGFFDPRYNWIVDAVTGERIRFVCAAERKRIMQQCRMNQNDFECRHRAEKDLKEIDTDSWVSSDDE